MRFPRTLYLIPLTVFAILLTSLAHADFQDGLDAYDRGDYTTALKEWRPLAEEGDALVQYNLGTLYEMGQGVYTPMKYA
jgi:TPR repeat protein